MPDRIVNPVSVADFRDIARRRLPSFLFHYVDGGANDEDTLARNVNDFSRIRLLQRVMVDVSAVNPATELAGQRVSMPLALAPIGLGGMMRRRGEVQAVRAATRAGVPFTLSTVGVCSLEEVRQAAGDGAVWFQLYMLRDRDIVRRMLGRAQELGVRKLVFTVDLATEGVRRRDLRGGMVGTSAAARLARGWQVLTHPRWVYDVAMRGKPLDFGNLRDFATDATDLNAYKEFIGGQFDRSVTWKDIAWLRENWEGWIAIKGVLNAEDARAAVAAGADAVIVSNHGGRQLDGVSSTIAALPRIAEAVGSDTEVLLDGGVRSGIDVVRAVALGARGVLIGRPWVYALAARGEAGVAQLLASFHREITAAMALMGVNRVDEIGRDCLDGDAGSGSA